MGLKKKTSLVVRGIVLACILVLIYSIHVVLYGNSYMNGDSLLHIAVDHHWVKIVNGLLLIKADVNNNNWGRLTPLMFAARNHDIPMIKILLNHGANINAKTSDGVGVIGLAIPASKLKLFPKSDESLDTITYLARKGAHIDDLYKDGDTPLYDAIMSDYPKVVEYLLNTGASIKCNSNFTMSYLQEAAIYTDDSYIIKSLLAHGDDCNNYNYNGTDPVRRHMPYNHISPEKVALQNHHFTIAKLLHDYKSKPRY